jgi:hypothetical protein
LSSLQPEFFSNLLMLAVQKFEPWFTEQLLEFHWTAISWYTAAKIDSSAYKPLYAGKLRINH